ncbi:hypothetical protein [Prevotella sp.]|uniref:hypothetical protein n=1 Tax=Prevotella sp. TaxID=59823 RepID=UPI00402992B2
MTQKYIKGDIVMYDNRIHTIMDTLELNNYELSYIRYQVNQLELSGVPLTTEILEKKGWKEEVMSRGVKNSHLVYTKPDIEEYGYFPIYIEKGIGDEFDVYPFTDNNVCKPIAYIKYVHQLQHLLFGLGLNAEMEV